MGNRFRTLLFLLVTVFVLAAGRVNASPNLVVKEVISSGGRQVSFLAGEDGALKSGDMYDVYSKGRKLAEVAILRTGFGESLSEARTLDGNMAGMKDSLVTLIATPYSLRKVPGGMLTTQELARTGPKMIPSRNGVSEEPPENMDPKVAHLAPEPEPEEEEEEEPTITPIPVIDIPLYEPVEVAPPAPRSPYVVHGLLRLEYHSDMYNPDDYLYAMLSASRQVHDDRVDTVYYIRRENLDHRENQADTLGVSLVQTIDPRTHATFGFSYTEEENSWGREEWDYYTYRLGVSRIFHRQENTYHKAGFSYVIRDHDLEDKSGYFRYSLHHRISENRKGRLSYLYTYSDDYNVHISNQYGASLTFINPGITVEYIFVDKTYILPSILQVDDDEIFRFSYLHRF